MNDEDGRSQFEVAPPARSNLHRSSLIVHRSSFSLPSFGPKYRHDRRIRLQARRTDQIQTVGHGGKDRVQAFADAFGLAWQVDDQAPTADAGGLAGEDGRWYEFEGRRSHLLAETGEQLVAGGGSGLWGDISRGRAGAAGGHDQVARFGVGQSVDRVDDCGEIIGDKAVKIGPG